MKVNIVAPNLTGFPQGDLYRSQESGLKLRLILQNLI